MHTTEKRRRGAPKRSVAAALVAAALAAGVAAFAGTSASSAKGTAGAADHVSISMELVLTGVQFAQDASLGMKTAAADAGNTTITITGPPSINPVLAQQHVTSAVAQSPDGIGIDPFTPDLWGRTLKTVSGQVKNILLMNDKPVISPSQLGSAAVKTYVGISDANYARALATAAIKGGKLVPSTTGEVLLGQCVPGSTGVLAERNTAFLQVIHKLLPKTKVIQFNSQVVPAKNTAAWTSELTAHPKAVLAIGGCDQDGTSLYLVKKKLGLKVAAGGIDLTPEAIKGVADGTLAATLVDDYFVQGYVAASLLINAARGKPLPVGWIDTGYTLVTKANVASIKAAAASDKAAIAYWTPKAKAILRNLKPQPLKAAWGGLTN
ncbi:MAG: sugar ABC transporter substrate-binding protein [Actinomycetota bacterium]|nr:sugar ABC transporter substrate-binding protein [Actinomycetota bacterium]